MACVNLFLAKKMFKLWKRREEKRREGERGKMVSDFFCFIFLVGNIFCSAEVAHNEIGEGLRGPTINVSCTWEFSTRHINVSYAFHTHTKKINYARLQIRIVCVSAHTFGSLRLIHFRSLIACPSSASSTLASIKLLNWK